jgi:hypothetical protein
MPCTQNRTNIAMLGCCGEAVLSTRIKKFTMTVYFNANDFTFAEAQEDAQTQLLAKSWDEIDYDFQKNFYRRIFSTGGPTEWEDTGQQDSPLSGPGGNSRNQCLEPYMPLPFIQHFDIITSLSGFDFFYGTFVHLERMLVEGSNPSTTNACYMRIWQEEGTLACHRDECGQLDLPADIMNPLRIAGESVKSWRTAVSNESVGPLLTGTDCCNPAP